MIEKLNVLRMLDGNPDAIKTYLNVIADDSDEYVSAGALYQLLVNDLLDLQNVDLLMSRLHLPCVRRQAVFFLTKNNEGLQLAARAIEEEKKTKPYDHARRLQYVIDNDLAKLIESEAALFLENGQIEHLFNAAAHAKEFSGENGALPWMIRAMLIAPMHPNSVLQTLELLNHGDNILGLESLVDKLIAWNIQPAIARIYSAHVLLHKGNLAEFYDVIRHIPVDHLKHDLKSRVYGLIAKAKEKEGKYGEASDYYLRQNTLDMPDSKARKGVFPKGVLALETLQFEGSPPSTPLNHFMMLGFPRTGSTLLENALACHPEIEAFEEKDYPFLYLQNALREIINRPEANKVVDSNAWQIACEKYYDWFQRNRTKDGASVIIDKMPTRSAYAGLLANCFPEQRYIFTIRHPYDVVLSCYKQDFLNHPIMEHFKRFEDACVLYDFTMKQWFKYFTEDDPRVCYIKYDSLVEEFQCEMTRILKFLGLQWNDNVMNFAEIAQRRPATTPSYSKVRQGLELGVQSSWEKYRFLYDDTNNKFMDPWVKKFGYEGI